jgi:hypothetical protein
MKSRFLSVEAHHLVEIRVLHRIDPSLRHAD